MDATTYQSLGERMRCAARLASPLYRDVAAAGGSNRDALVVVLIAALGFGVGTLLGWAVAGSPLTGLVAGIILEPLATLAAWVGGSVAAWVVGTWLAPSGARPAGFWSVARALAFAQTPNLFGVLAVLPAPFRGGVWLVLRCWTLAASSTAIRESLGLSGGRTLVTLVISAAIYAALLVGIFQALALAGVGSVLSISGSVGL